jgi:hypothetical protein
MKYKAAHPEIEAYQVKHERVLKVGDWLCFDSKDFAILTNKEFENSYVESKPPDKAIGWVCDGCGLVNDFGYFRCPTCKWEPRNGGYFRYRPLED